MSSPSPWSVFLLFLLVATAAQSLDEDPSFKIYIEEAGVYRVTFEDLADAGLDAPLPVPALGLTAGGEDVPIWVEDGGDGLLGPGDSIEFVGRHLRGDVSYFHEHSRYNVYTLAVDPSSTASARLVPLETSLANQGPAGLRYRREQHLEEDRLRLRLASHADEEPQELWYSSKLVFGSEPFNQVFDLNDLDPKRAPIELRLSLRAWSSPLNKTEPGLADHRLDVLWNGESVGFSEWDGTAPHLMTLDLPKLKPGKHTLSLSVPTRTPAGSTDPLIDVIMLNWMEISYPSGPGVDDQAQLRIESLDIPPSQIRRAQKSPTRTGRLLSFRGRPLIAFGESGWRSVAVAKKDKDFRLAIPKDETSIFVTADDAFRSPPAVVYDRPSNLRDADQQVDYIMIAHRSLLDPIGDLAAAHRDRGLSVLEVDLQDVYDEFAHGVATPEAIRDFLRYAHTTWRSPAPRFVLLVGDASWDARNARVEDQNYADWTNRPWEQSLFEKNTSYPYADGAGLNNRGLMPTWGYNTIEGPAASDNYFVSFDEDDDLPDMAIGRFPVVKPEEVEAIVAKTLRFLDADNVGPWRRDTLLITNESSAFQHRSNLLARQMVDSGLGAQKIYPVSSETSNEHHSEFLLKAFDEGQLLIHFLGHGGRYIWRTGPPDLEKDHDLFTLEHLDQLKPHDRLPVVLSLTCYSAPFDHPNADSIGEKLLRLDSRGAVAVFAASWRNVPGPIWGKVLTSELTRPGTTVGEAIQRAKNKITGAKFVQTYNLLGDPALPMALPGGRVELQATSKKRALDLAGRVNLEDFRGKLIVEVVDRDGDTLKRVQRRLKNPDFDLKLRLRKKFEAAQAVHVYAWNPVINADAAGVFKLNAKTSKPLRGSP